MTVNEAQRAATTAKCCCGHPRSSHRLIRLSSPHRFGPCIRCVCDDFLKGDYDPLPLHEILYEQVVVPKEQRIPVTVESCSECGRRRKCVEGICYSCADTLVGL